MAGRRQHGMFVSQTSEYALRAMAHLARLAPGEAARAADLAEAANIPQHYVSKILRQLVVAGLLASRRGHHGGFVLRRPPSRIPVRAVLEATGTTLEPEHCAFGWSRCNQAEPCPLHPVWDGMKTVLGSWADGTTLADVTGARRVRRGRR